MSREVLFEGATLIIPGAASFTDTSQLATAPNLGAGVVAVVGESEGGPGYNTGVITTITPQNAAQMKKLFRSGPIADAIGVAFQPANDDAIQGGAQTLLAVRVNQAVQASLNLSKGATALVGLLADNYGTPGNLISVQVTSVVVGSGTARVITLVFETETIVSPQLGTRDPSSTQGAMFTVNYTGPGATCTLTTDGTQLIVTAGFGSLPADSFVLPFTTYKTIQSIVNYFAALTNFGVTSVTPDASVRASSALDHIISVPLNIKQLTQQPLYSSVYDIVTWLNANNDLVTATRLATNVIDEGQIDALAPTFLTGGSLGPALANSDWQNAVNLLKLVDLDSVVPLISANEGSVLIDSVNAIFDAHAAAMCAPGGNHERRAHLSKTGSKTTLITAIQNVNDAFSSFYGQQMQFLDHTGTLVFFPEWGAALDFACMRAGMVDEGEPVTHKFSRATAVQQDISWTPEIDGPTMLLAGLTMFQKVAGQGIRCVKGVTTYSKSDNDALVDESQVVEWLAIAKRVRDRLSDKFVGQKGDVATIQAVVQEIVAQLEEERSDRKTITDSVVNGVVTRAYTDPVVSFSGSTLSYTYGIGVTPGINFITGIQTLSPVNISV